MIVMKMKKAKGTKKCIIKWTLKLEDYKHCLEGTQLDIKKKQLEKNKIDVDRIMKIE